MSEFVLAIETGREGFTRVGTCPPPPPALSSPETDKGGYDLTKSFGKATLSV